VRLETDRLTIRPWESNDAPRLFEMLSNPEIVRWLGTPTVMTELIEAERKIEAEQDRIEPRGVWAIAVRATGVVVGSVMLVEVPGSDDLTQIGWYLHHDSSGHGYATEAAAAVLRFGLAAGLAEIHALTHLDNQASIAVALRIGMTDLGQTDQWHDEASRHFAVRADPGSDSGLRQG
jgi:RimJ/RimL family protein N-acetyltransferase